MVSEWPPSACRIGRHERPIRPGRALASVRRHSEDGLSLFMKVNSLGLGEEPIVVVDADLGRASA